MFAAQRRLPPLPAGELPILREDNASANPALRAAMEEAGHWDPREMSRRWLLEDPCYMVLDGARCVHYSWMSKRMLVISELGYRADLNGGSHWLYNAYTSPTHRGRSIFPEVLQSMTADALAQDGGVVWAGVQDTNAASMNGVSKAGFKEAFILEKKTFLSSMETQSSRTVLDARLTALFDDASCVRGRAFAHHGY